VPSPESAPGAAPERLSAELTLDGLLSAWGSLSQAAREQSRFLGEALGAARPVAVTPPEVQLAIPDANPMHVEALTRQRDAVERLLSQATGQPVRLVIANQATAPGGSAPRARRLTETEAKAERLKALRARDPALELAAESLDLEVLE
jgi:hypothetical protein